MHSTSNKVNIGCNLISLCVALGKPNTQKSNMIGQIVFFLTVIGQFVNIYAAIRVFEPVALAVFERFGVNHLALNSLFYSVILCWQDPSGELADVLPCFLFFFGDPLEKHWISVWGFNCYAKNMNRNRPGNLVEINWQKWKLYAGCVCKCVIICIADGDVVSDVAWAAMWCIYMWKKWGFIFPFFFQIFVLFSFFVLFFAIWQQWFLSWPWPKKILSRRFVGSRFQTEYK